MNKVGTLRWDGAVAQARMDNLLSAYYGKDKVHAVLSPYDGISIGILSSLKGVGYCTAQQPCPVVSGQDAEVPSIKSILKGEQYSTVFKDTRELAKVAANMVDAVLTGKQPEINDTKTYNNGVKVVPSYLLKPVAVDASNWKPRAHRQRLLHRSAGQVSLHTDGWGPPYHSVPGPASRGLSDLPAASLRARAIHGSRPPPCC